MENGLPAKADVAVVKKSGLIECPEVVLNCKAMRYFLEHCRRMRDFHVFWDNWSKKTKRHEFDYWWPVNRGSKWNVYQ